MTVVDILEAFRRKIAEGQHPTIKMRAEESDKIDYIDRYRERGVDEGFDPDWNRFIELWNDRKNSPDDMAELLAEVVGVAHDEALAWIEDY